MKNRFSTVLLLLVLSVCSLSAMTNCPAPAPVSGAIIDEGNNAIRLRWEEVPGAISYEITTINLTNGNSISSNVLTDTEHEESNLEPDNDYQFEIRASYCEGGPYGQPLVLRAKTTIIIVDVILQMECEDDELETIYSGTVSAGDNTAIDIPSDDEGCYLIEISTINIEPSVDLSLVLSANEFGGLTLNNFVSNPNNFQLMGNRPVRGVLMDSPPGSNLQLVNINANKDKKNNFETDFTWFQDMTIDIFYCENCELTKPNVPRFPAPVVVKSNDIKIYPNPVANLLQLQIPKKGLVQVWDLTGRLWFNAESEENEDFEIDTSNWPSGTYTLRWNEGSNSPPEIKLFLKL